MATETKEIICCFCENPVEKECTSDGTVYWAGGHNPAPACSEPEARCCGTCNHCIVLPSRMAKIFSA